MAGTDEAAASSGIPTRALVLSVLRVLLVLGVLTAAFAFVPVRSGEAADKAVVWAGLLALLLFGVAFLRQIRHILASPYPMVAAVEALVVVIAVFVLGFALVHVSLSQGDPASYSEPMDKVDAVYFTVTVLSTVGFGDIAARATSARVVVTIQMLADLALIAVTLRVIFGVARHADRRRRSADAQDTTVERSEAATPDAPPGAA